MSDRVSGLNIAGTNHSHRGWLRPFLTLAISASFLIPVLASGPALSQEDPYLKCVDVKKSKKRLACYDEVIREQHPVLFEKIAKANKEEQQEEFGKPVPTEKGEKELDELEIVIVELGKNPYGKWLLITDSGQIWKQVDDVRIRLRGKNLKGRIKKGLMGAFFFLPEGKKYGFKVKRIR
ncbi:MAG: hypothetical protein V3R73_06400 [Sphingomonadales bacterium]